MDRDAVLKNFFSHQHPLGEVTALERDEEQSHLVFSSYFDSENQPIQDLQREPSMIAGRKGSGKTDSLLSYRYASKASDRYAPVVYFEASHAAKLISTVINQLSDVVYDNYPPPTVEAISDFWDSLFWITILEGIAQGSAERNSDEYSLISQFISSLFEDDTEHQTPYHTILSAIVKLRIGYNRSDYSMAGIDFFSAQDKIGFAGLTISDAVTAAYSYLKRTRNKAIVLFDSIEALDLDESHNKLVVAGLLKTVGSFQSSGPYAQFRCCVPAESYFKLIEMSSNVLKDFRNIHILHWHSSELLRICAKRYAEYLRLFAPEAVDEYVKPFNGFFKRSDVLKFWNKILPPRIPNTRKGSYEKTLPYIIRHTQLLPRHFLLIFNGFLSSAIQRTDSADPTLISVDEITSAVRETESRMVDQILDSYSAIWPDANEAMREVLPNLGTNIIRYSEFHTIYNRSATRHVHRNIDDFGDFLRMLSELGAVGRLTELTDEYAVAIFEYAEPHRMILTPADTLCIHPIFTERYRVIVPEDVPQSYSPVYPLGTDPRSPDYRDE